MFVVFEGLDRVGKSTQLALLSELLRHQGISVSTFKYPGNLFDRVKVLNLQIA
jgi:thymidylate kinase